MIVSRYLALILASAIALCSFGCGGARDGLTRRLDDLHKEIQDLGESHKALNQRIESLKDRLALVEDRSEAQSLNQQMRARLPMVKVKPTRKDKKVQSQVPPVTITQDQIDALSVRRVSPPARKPRQPVVLPANATRAGNIGVVKSKRKAAGRSGIGGPRGRDHDPIAAYKRARALYSGGNLSEALRAFKEFGQRWPQHSYADNALYWLGRGRFERAEYPAALRILRRVLKDYPTGNQVPPTLLMLGLTLDRLGQPRQARETLMRLKAIYPNTKAGRVATDMLRGSQTDR